MFRNCANLFFKTLTYLRRNTMCMSFTLYSLLSWRAIGEMGHEMSSNNPNIAIYIITRAFSVYKGLCESYQVRLNDDDISKATDRILWLTEVFVSTADGSKVQGLNWSSVAADKYLVSMSRFYYSNGSNSSTRIPGSSALALRRLHTQHIGDLELGP